MKCPNCGRSYYNSYKYSRHMRRMHPTEEYETPDEFLGGPDSEQRDFDGEEPDTSEHDPEYETTNDPDTGKQGDLRRYE